MKNEAQTLKNIQDVFFGNYHMKFNSTANFMKRSIGTACDWGKGRTIELTDNFDIFLAQNKGNGPPGRQRSPNAPVTDNDPFINRIFAEPFGGDSTTNGPEFLKQEKQNDFDKNNNKFTIHFLNFTLMKKQIFILILAVFASVTVAFGQSAVHGVSPNPLTGCTDDALHPIAGKPYNYNVGVSPAPSAGAQYQWWATPGPNFIQSGAVTLAGSYTVTTNQLLGTSAGYGAVGPYSTMTITWSSSLLAETVSGTATAPKHNTFVAVNYQDPSSACANNLKVYQLDPINGFTVDIFNIETSSQNTLASGATTSDCVSGIASAVWGGSILNYDYGTETVTYEVVAANFSDSWTPAFQVGALGNGQTADLQWAYDKAFTQGLVTVQSGISASGGTYTSSTTANTSVTDTSNGVSIYVRLIIHNNTFEGINSTTVSLAVNGVNSANQADVVNTACNTYQYMEDVVTRTLTPRPALTPTTPTGGFVPADSTN